MKQQAGYFNNTETRVLLHLMHGGRHTVRSIAGALDLSPSTVYDALRWLRACGLVRWNEGAQATLRANVRAVPLPARRQQARQ